MQSRLYLVIIVLSLAMPMISAQLAIRGETVYTMSGKPIKNGVVLVRNGKIAAVGTADALKIPRGDRVLEAKVVTPGLIDAHTVVGLAGILNYAHDQEQLERSHPIQPELRAMDAYNARDPLVEWVRNFGVTTIHTGHAPGVLVSGQTMIVKTAGKTYEQAVMVPVAMIAATLGSGARALQGSPGNRSKAVAMLRSSLLKARNAIKARRLAKKKKKQGNGNQNGNGTKKSKTDPLARNLRQEIWELVLKKEIPLLVTVQRHHDILTAIRIAKEFDIRIILDDAPEAYLVLDEIKDAGIPVIVHPTMYRSAGERENLSMETAATLKKAGIPIALQSGYESYVPKTRVVLFEAAIAAANGLSFEEALAAITIDAAELLGISDRVGSIAPGKDADLALYDGDPFEYTTHCTAVVIDGQVVSDEAH